MDGFAVAVGEHPAIAVSEADGLYALLLSAIVYNLVGLPRRRWALSHDEAASAWFVERLGLVVTAAQGTRSEHGRFADRRPDDRPDDDVAGAVGGSMPVVGAPLRGLAAAVAYSRVHTGVHYPGDVVIGSVIGATIGEATMLAARALRRRHDQT